jgi:hypothetical protein
MEAFGRKFNETEDVVVMGNGGSVDPTSGEIVRKNFNER